jgi:hypothetical protein
MTEVKVSEFAKISDSTMAAQSVISVFTPYSMEFHAITEKFNAALLATPIAVQLTGQIGALVSVVRVQGTRSHLCFSEITSCAIICVSRCKSRPS